MKTLFLILVAVLIAGTCHASGIFEDGLFRTTTNAGCYGYNTTGSAINIKDYADLMKGMSAAVIANKAVPDNSGTNTR
jgi:hypothetical protein